MPLALLACVGATVGKDGDGVSGPSNGQNAGAKNVGRETVGDHFAGVGGNAGTAVTQVGGAGGQGERADSFFPDGGGSAQPTDAGAVTVTIGPCPNGVAPTRVVQAGVDGITVTPTHVYWLGGNLVVMRQSKATGMIDRLADMANRGTRILADATRVYWEERDNYFNIYSMPLDLSAPPVRVAAGVSAWAVGPDRVYFWKGLDLDSAPKTGGVSALVLADVIASGNIRGRRRSKDRVRHRFRAELGRGRFGCLHRHFWRHLESKQGTVNPRQRAPRRRRPARVRSRPPDAGV